VSFFYAHGSIAWTTGQSATTTIDVTCTDATSGTFQPKAVRLWCVGISSATDATSTTLNMRRSHGFATGTAARRCIATLDADVNEDAAATAMICCAAMYDDCVIATVAKTPARDGALDFNGFLSTGFQMIVDDATPVNITVFFEAWGGTDITVADVGTISEPATATTVDSTVTGFTSGATDQIVFFGGCHQVTANTVTRQDSGFMVGAASGTGAANNIVMWGNNDDGSNLADTDRIGVSGLCLSACTIAGGNAAATASLSAFGTNQFTVSFATRALTNRKYIYLAMKGGQWTAADLNFPGSGNDVTVSSLSYTPQGLSFMCQGDVEQTSPTSIAHDILSMGCASSTSSRRSQGADSENGAGDGTITLNIQYDEVLSWTHAGTTYSIDITAISGTGFTLTAEDSLAGVNPANWVGYVACAGVPVAAAPSVAPPFRFTRGTDLESLPSAS